MKYVRGFLITAGVAAVCLAIGGCGSSKSPTAGTISTEEFKRSWAPNESVVVTKPKSTAVLQGSAPLAYIVPQAGEVWLTDGTGRQWGPTQVAGNTLVRVTRDGGIVVGELRLERGPLTDGATYTIHQNVP